MKRFFFAVFIALFAAASLSAQQRAIETEAHWCDRANPNRLSPTETTICSDPSLISLDMQMAALFYARRDTYADLDRRRFSRAQTGFWLPYRDSCVSDAACIRGRYEARIFELGESVPSAAVQVTPDGWIETSNPDGSISVFVPGTGQKGTKQANGEVVWNPIMMPITGVGSREPPLIESNEALLFLVEERLEELLLTVFDETQLNHLEPHAPTGFLGQLEFYLDAVSYILGG